MPYPSGLPPDISAFPQPNPGFPLGPPPQPQQLPPQQPQPYVPKFTKKFIDKASDFFRAEARISARWVEQKKARHQLLEDLYRGRRKYRDWNQRLARVIRSGEQMENADWKSDLVISCVPIVHSYADRLSNLLFASKNYWNVFAQPTSPDTVEDPFFSTSKKIQSLLLEKNRMWDFEAETDRIIKDGVLFGTAVPVHYYYKKVINRFEIDPLTGQPTPNPIIREFPAYKLVPLDMLIPDYAATDADVQKHRFIGHRVLVPVSKIMQRYNQGIYTLNKDKFTERFQGGSGYDWTFELTERQWSDTDLNSMAEGSSQPMVVVWDIHGEFADDEGVHQECIFTCVTPRAEDDPTDAVVLRCDPGPAVPTGIRPFSGWQLTPTSTFFGQSRVEDNLDVIFYLSGFLNMLVDNARIQTNAEMLIKDSSPSYTRMMDGSLKKDRAPGKWWPVESFEDMKPMPPTQVPTEAARYIMQFLHNYYQQITGVSESTLAMGQGEETATGRHYQSQMADVPLKAISRRFCRSVWEPFGDFAIAMLQRNVNDPQQVTLKDSGDRDVMQVLSPEELSTGKYRIESALTMGDQEKLAQAQSLERILPALGQLKGVVLSEGKDISVSNTLRLWLEKLSHDNPDQIITPVDPQTAQTLQMLQSLPPEMLQGVIQHFQMMQQMQMQQQQGGMPPGQQGPPQQEGPPQGPPLPSPEQMPQPHPIGQNGTPMGPDAVDPAANVAQLLQLQAAARQSGELQ